MIPTSEFKSKWGYRKRDDGKFVVTFGKHDTFGIYDHEDEVVEMINDFNDPRNKDWGWGFDQFPDTDEDKKK